jgi:chitinase
LNKKDIRGAILFLLFLVLLGCTVTPDNNDIETIHNPKIQVSSTFHTENVNSQEQTSENSRSNSSISSVVSKAALSSLPSSGDVSSGGSKKSSSSENSASTTTGGSKTSVSSKSDILSRPTSSSETGYTSNTSQSTKKYVVGYYTSWSAYKGFTPDKIDASKLTHINYAFADISPDLKLVLENPTTDLKNLEGLRNLKKRNSNLKIIISVGGWDNSKYFSDAAASEKSREVFSQSCVDFIIHNQLDGIDVDWEYPVSGGLLGNSHRSEDKQNFTKLVQLIRQKLNEQTARDGKKYFLTITGATSSGFIRNIDLTGMLPSLDYLFIMGYDIHGPWESYTNFNAPLYSSDSENINQSIVNYLNAGAPSGKLVLGMPFYGYLYQTTDSNTNGFNNLFTSSKSLGFDTIYSTYLNNSIYTKYFDNRAMVPYLYGNNTFLTYEDANSISLKVNLAKKYRLAGVGAWELSFDKNSTLLTAAYNTLI